MGEYGCRVYSRLVEHNAKTEEVKLLVDQALTKVDVLVPHAFGHHVLETVLEHGLDHQRRQIVRALQQDLPSRLQSRYATYVVVKALSHGITEDSEALAWQLLAQPSEDVAAWAASQFGSPIARAFLRQPRPLHQALREHLRKPDSLALLQSSKHGRRLCIDLGIGLPCGSPPADAQ